MCFRCDDPIPDEIPGNPETVSSFAKAFSTTAEALREAAAELSNLANDDITISEAVDEVRSKAGDASGDTERVAVRYQGAAETFSAYAGALSDAHANGNGARTQIISNNDNGRYWRHRQNQLRDQAMWGNTDPELLADLEEANRQANHYDSQYTTYLAQYNAAVSSWETAVNDAVNGLRDAESDSNLNDGFWDGVLGDLQLLWELASKYLGPVLEILRDVLEILKKIVDVLALIVTVLALFIPVLAPLAAALSALAVILSVAIFACSALLFLMGRESLGRVLADGISALTSVITSKLGGGNGLFDDVASAFSGVTQRSAAVAAGSTVPLVVRPTSNQVADLLQSQTIGGLVSAYGTPVNYFVSEGLDFELSHLGQQPWGAPPKPVWDLSDATPTDMLPGFADIATFGTASPLAGMFDWDYDIGASWNEMTDVWGSVNAVPAS